MKSVLVNCMPDEMYLRFRRGFFRLKSPQEYSNYQWRRRNQDENARSYRHFDENKAIFVHIPKCAGRAFNKALFGGYAGGHTTLNQYLLIFSAKEIDRYFKFTIVRNPWDRLVSAFHFLKQGGLDEYDRRWAEKELAPYADFSSFVKGWLNQDNIWKWYHFQPQYHYMQDRYNKITLDFVGYFENLQADFDYIARCLGKEVPLVKTNHSRREDYQEYFDDEMIDIVRDVYRKDIELLGYSFDNANMDTLIMQRNNAMGLFCGNKNEG